MADSTRVEIFEIEIKNLQSIDELNKQLAEARKSYKSAQVGTEEYIKAQNDITSVNAKLGEHKNKLKEVENQSKLNDNTIEGLRAKYKSLSAEIVKTDLGNGKLSKSYLDLKNQAKAVSDRLKGLEDGFGNNTRNVGNYTESIKTAIAGTGSFGNSIVSLGATLATNPIGLLAIALTGLFKLFQQNDQAATFFAGVMQAVDIGISNLSTGIVEAVKVFEPFSGVLSEIGTRLLNAIIAPIQVFMDLLPAVSALMDGEFKKAANIAGEATLKFGKSALFLNDQLPPIAENMKAATQAGIDYKAAMDAIEESQKKSLVTLAQLNQIIAVEEKALKNTTISYEEKLAIIDKIQKADQQRINIKLKLINEELKAERKLFESAGDNSNLREKAQFRILELEAQRVEAQTESLALLEKIENKKDAAAAAEAARINKVLEKDQEYQAFKTAATSENLTNLETVNSAQRDASQQEEEIDREAQDNMTADLEKFEKDRLKIIEDAEKEKQQQIQNTFAITSAVTALGRQLAGDSFEAQKALSVTEAIINTAKGVTNALGSAPPPVNFVLAALTGALGAAQVATIASAQPPSAAAGGGDFVTTKPTLLLVGDNPGGRERVSVTPLSGRGQTRVAKNSGLIAMAGGGSLTVDSSGMSQVGNSIGGDILSQSNLSRSIAETMASIGTPVVSVVDIKRVTNKTNVTESRAKLRA
jgi:hypothetical protein